VKIYCALFIHALCVFGSEYSLLDTIFDEGINIFLILSFFLRELRVLYTSTIANSIICIRKM
jgi:hypothetical protein